MMYHTKKMLSLLFAVIMLISLVGCSGNTEPPQGTTEATNATEQTTTAPTASDETADTTEPTQSADTLTVHENTLFTVGYDQEQGWTLAEDDFSVYESGGNVYLRILDADSTTGILVKIDAYEEHASAFRETLQANGIDLKAYAEGTLETMDISGQPMAWVDDGDGERDFFGRNVAAGVSYSITASHWDDPRVQELIGNITWTASKTDNMDPPWPWEGAPFSGGSLSQVVGTHTLTADFIAMAEPMVTYETFDHDIAVIGDKVYLLSDGILSQFAYDGASLTFLKEIALDAEYSIMDKTTNSEIVLSDFMDPVIGHDGESVKYSYEGPDKFSVAPNGTWGISWFASGDDCKLYSFRDGTLVGEDFTLAEVDSISNISIDRNYILVSGSSKEDGEHYLFAYDYSGELQLKLTGEPDGFGLGSISYAISTDNGFLALDANMREVVLWTADGTWIGAVDDAALFGTGYPWMAAADVAEDGSILIVMSDTRADESADEVLVFKLSGF